jgi:hypothetical protein
VRWVLLTVCLWGCQGATPRYEGRPCSATEPCGPGTRCDLAQKVCVKDQAATDGPKIGDRLIHDWSVEGNTIADWRSGEGNTVIEGGVHDRSTHDQSTSCGVCDGCCQGSTCVAVAAQTTQSCGLKGQACASCVDLNECTSDACVAGACSNKALPDGTTCVTGTCKSGVCSGCVPACGGKQCGADTCGGSCGTCVSPKTCNTTTGQCFCTPACGGKQCGADTCGGSCGTCVSPKTCNTTTGQCFCTPACGGKNCGADGCNGSCGTCGSSDYCLSGVCTACPSCGSLGFYTGSLRGCTFSGSNGCTCPGTDGNGNDTCDSGESCWGSDLCSSGDHNPANCQTKKNINVPAGCTPPGYCFECS